MNSQKTGLAVRLRDHLRRITGSVQNWTTTNEPAPPAYMFEMMPHCIPEGVHVYWATPETRIESEVRK